MVEHYAIAVSAPNLLPVPEGKQENSKSPKKHLQDASNIFSSVKGYIRILECKLCANILDRFLVLATEDEIVINMSFLQANHHRCHFDELGFRTDEDVNHLG